jgi:hypothetical protein
LWVSECRFDYGDGMPWAICAVQEFRDGEDRPHHRVLRLAVRSRRLADRHRGADPRVRAGQPTWLSSMMLPSLSLSQATL